ncbi:hypothetical protein [Amycolatopsis nivea]|uniref:hypothetical protein n=1 Tax=Amycolatopsis nivea TaxID=1644109 RepID=UPI001F0D07C3|nr:hypothetical protein [Amycolatopsis nivea]
MGTLRDVLVGAEDGRDVAWVGVPETDEQAVMASNSRLPVVASATGFAGSAALGRMMSSTARAGITYLP